MVSGVLSDSCCSDFNLRTCVASAITAFMISVSDSNFESLENDEQKAIDAKKKASSAPAPQL